METPIRLLSVTADAKALGVSRIHLWRVATGRWKNPELLSRYRALTAERRARAARGMVLPVGCRFALADRSLAARLVEHFSGAVRTDRDAFEVVHPLIITPIEPETETLPDEERTFSAKQKPPSKTARANNR